LGTGQDRAVAFGCLTKRVRNMAKVLTIEDDELIARDVVRTLTASGLTVDVAHTGCEGLAKLGIAF
jgi:ActR/RegA family two-component response regulator